VRLGLARPCNVAVHLTLNVPLIHCRVTVKVLNHLVARPMLGMHTGIDSQSNTSPHFVFQTAVIAVWVLVETDLLRDGNLQVMSGNAFVIGDGFKIREERVFGIPLVHVDTARTGAVRRAQ
jgi:hypothetical protein